MACWSKQPLTHQETWVKVTTLATVSTPLLAATFLQHQGASSFPVPCVFRLCTGIPCPGCGMGRSFVAIAHGDFGLAVQYHAYGPLVFLLCLLVGAIAGAELIQRRRLQSSQFKRFLKRYHLISLLGISLLGYYVGRLIVLNQVEALTKSFERSPLGQLLT